MIETKLVVLGGGPGGYAAAFLAADLGIETTIVDLSSKLGGTCLLRGCIPSKALLHVAKLIEETKHSADIGVDFGQPKIDLNKIRDHKNQIISNLTGGLAQLAKKRKVNVINACGKFIDSNTIQLEGGNPETYSQGDTLKFENCIIATGSIPAMPGFLNIGSSKIMNSSGALNLEDIPERMLVIGGGYIGLEMGTVYNSLGTKITVVEMEKNLLPGADADMVRPLAAKLKTQFENIYLSTKVAKVQEIEGKVEVTFEGKKEGTELFDRVLVSVGRRPHNQGYGLENINIEIDERGFIVVDEQLRTAEQNIFAIGDIIGDPMLAHKAAYEGKVAAEIIAGKNVKKENKPIPAVVFTDPEIGWVGPTEAELKAAGVKYKATKYPWLASGRAHANGRTDGSTKLLINPENDKIIAGAVTGFGAGELVAEITLAVEKGLTAHELSQTIHAHPTMSETTAFAAESYYGLATEIYKPKRK